MTTRSILSNTAPTVSPTNPKFIIPFANATASPIVPSIIPGILSTILIITLIALVSFTVARLLDYLYVRQPIKDDASDISDNTKDIIRQQINILKFSLDEDKRRLRRLSKQSKSKSDSEVPQVENQEVNPSASIPTANGTVPHEEDDMDNEELDTERINQLMNMWTNSIISKIHSGNFPLSSADFNFEDSKGEHSDITLNAKQMATEVMKKAPPPGSASSKDRSNFADYSTIEESSQAFQIPSFPSALERDSSSPDKQSKYSVSIV